MKFFEDKRVKSFFIAGALLVAFAFLFIKYEGFVQMAGKVVKVFRPVMIGAFIAFALNNPLNFITEKYEKIYDGMYNKKLEKLKKKNNGHLPAVLPEKSSMPSKLAIVSVYICMALFLTLLVMIIVPQLADSINIFVNNFDIYYKNAETLIMKYYRNKNLMIAKWIEDFKILEKIYSLAEYIPDLLVKTFGATASFLSAVIDICLGFVLSVYILAEKKHLKDQGQRLGKRFCSREKYDLISKYLKLISGKFSNFIGGQLTEAFILGMFCFIGMRIFGFEYAVLISTIIGLTNLIPIVGPIIGTVPSAFILFLADPKAAVWFIVYIIILQQIESNLIYPRVVGNSMGLPALWVSVAVIVGGGLQGVFGMVVAIPLMSCAYAVLKEKVDENNVQGQQGGV